MTRVEPTGTDVTVTMAYDDEVKLPADAKAVIIAPSVVGDRYVQLTPAYSGTGDVLTDGAELSVDDTSQPLELDQIYDSLDRLNVALGPRGANKTGALSDLLSVTADNFGGQGTTFRQTIKDFSRLSATLADNKEELFGSVEALEGFMRDAGRQRPDGPPVQPVARRRLDDARGRARGAGRRDQEPLRRADRGEGLRGGEQGLAEPQHHRPQPGRPRCSCASATRSTRSCTWRRRPSTTSRLTYNPQAGTLDTRANLGEAINQIEADPAALLCGFVGQVERSGQVVRHDHRPARPAAPGALGTPDVLPAQDVFDPTLGGLVAPDRRWSDEAPEGTRAGRGRGAGPVRRATPASTPCPLPGGPDVGDNPMTIKVEFADVLDLVPQSTVKVNDVSVGKVTAIDLEGYQALVTLEVRRDVELPDNAVAELRQTSLLGEKFVELSAPDAGRQRQRARRRRRRSRSSAPAATPRSRRCSAP